MNARDAIGVVIVNYNTGAYLARCVRAVLDSDTAVRVLVVDNASSDDSLKKLRATLPDDTGVGILKNPGNLGYARACNQGAAQLDGETLVFLNPDCEVQTDTLAALRDVLAADPGAGLAGALILNPDGREQRGTRRRLPTPGRALTTFTGLEKTGLGGVNLGGAPMPDAPLPVEAVSGALLCLRREAFEAVGGFDPGYFLHAEDLDLFARLAAAGWGVLFVPAARAVHALGVSSASAPLKTWWHKHAGMQRFYRAHLAPDQSIVTRGLVTAGIWLRWALLLPLVLLRALIRRGPPADFDPGS